MRKKLVGAATVAIMATTFAGKASASSYEVKPGDSLWKIANQFKTSVSRLKEINKLNTDIIFPKQVLKIDATSTSNQSAAPAARPSSSSTGSSSGSSATYTVKSGDYLIKIANMHNTSVAQLKSLNGLSSDLIRVGQVLKVSGSANGSPAQNSPAPTPAPSSGSGNSGGTYKIVAGDTLSKIAARYGTTVNRLKQINGLRSDLIFAGQTLKVSGGTSPGSSQPPQQASPAPTKPQPVKQTGSGVIDTAKSLVGTKYAWGGSSPAGFDCSGFIHYVFKQSGKSISRTSAEGYYNRSYFINNPQPGDLVFFKNTYKSGISHLGIYIGGGQFVHAGSNGVEISNVNNSYWKSKFDSYKKFY
ncbi:LysM peptidoglycan-binding domain-containing protein [Siminovitchia sp. FSL W7-1587]|uniref:C40 family peptidase n=1 Tax=Siminovitchia sp. FSL W7-1587 TaxID=2954699 RepID=UPI0030D07F50